MSQRQRMPLIFRPDMLKYEYPETDEFGNIVSNDRNDTQSDKPAFNNNGLGFLPDGTRCEVTETLNGKFELAIDYPIAGRYYDSEHINIENIIYAPINPYGEMKDWEPFKIYRITKPINGLVTIYAEHRSYELQGYPCLPKTDYAEEGGWAANFMEYLTQQALQAGQALKLPAYTFETNLSIQKNWSIERPITIWDAMSQAVQLFGGEWEIRGTKCKLCEQRGENRGTVVRYGGNMLSLNQDEQNDTYTHIMPYWTDGTETVYVNGKYLACPNETNETRKKSIKILDMSSEFDEKPEPTDLQKAAMLTEEYINPPKIELTQKVSFIPREQTIEYAHLWDTDHVELGDTVGIVARPLNITSEARCVQLVYDVYRGVYKSATLGVVKATLTGALKEVSALVKDGVNVWVSPAEPKEGFKAGDYWIKIDNETYRTAQALGRREGGEWKLLCKYSGGGDGVGENVGYHNERFNFYGSSGNKINASSPAYDYNTARGINNTITDSFASTSSGNTNSITGGNGHDVGGLNNSVTGSGTANFIRGQLNTVKDGSYNGGFGYNNDLQSLWAHSCLVGGEDNKVNASRQLVGGLGNTAIAPSGVTVGDHNVNTQSFAMICGSYGYTSNENGSEAYYLAIGAGSSENSRNVFTVDVGGRVFAADYRTTGADYAEMFEWADGNPDNEDRCGMLVMLDGDKIVPAHGDDILGVVSAVPSVIGNNYDAEWRGKYQTDVYGRVLHGEDGHPLLSPDFDRDVQYIPRSKRPEWAAVGLVGQLVIRDDGSCTVGGYCTARNGTAQKTYSRTSIRVLRRIDETHVEVLIK